jgi:hypothetical protein
MFTTFLEGKLSYKQLIEKREKDQLDKAHLDQLNEAIKIADAFNEEYKAVEMTESALRRRLEAGDYN